MPADACTAPPLRQKPTGPLLLQGDHGIVAFRNIRISPSGAKTTRIRG